MSDRAWSRIALIVLVLIVIILVSGCIGITVEGECNVEREVRVTYVCKPGGKVESLRLLPLGVTVE